MISLTANADYGKTGQYIARITGRHSKFTFDREFIGRKCGKRNETTEADVDDPGLYECCDVGRKHGKESRFILVLDVDGDLMTFRSNKQDALAIAKAMDSGRSFHDIVVGTKADPEATNAQNELDDLIMRLLSSPSQDELAAETTLDRTIGPYAAGSTVKQADLHPVIKAEVDRLQAELDQLASQGKCSRSRYEIVGAKDAENRRQAQTIGTATDQCWTILQPLPAKEAKKVLDELKARLTPPKQTDHQD